MQNRIRSYVRGWLALALPALLPVAAFAEPLTLEAPPIEAPATATAPAPSANPLANPQVANGRILILPFQPVNPADANAWMGKSIQESIVADLTVTVPGRIVSSNQLAPTLEAAVALGKQNGARFVIAGGFVTADRELRITGQIVDVETGQAIGALKVTGEPSQVFGMEDALAMQVKGQLIPGSLPPQAPQQSGQSPAPVPQPDNTNAPPYSTYATPPMTAPYGADYNNYASYPGYDSYPYVYPSYDYPDYGYGYGSGWCYPGFGLGFFFGNGFHNHFRHFDRFNSFGGRSFTGLGVGVNRGFSGSVGLGVRSPAIIRGGVSSFSRGSTFRSSGAAPFRSQATFSHSYFGHTSSFGHSSGGFHTGGGFSHGGGGFSHGGGGGHGGHR